MSDVEVEGARLMVLVVEGSCSSSYSLFRIIRMLSKTLGYNVNLVDKKSCLKKRTTGPSLPSSPIVPIIGVLRVLDVDALTCKAL